VGLREQISAHFNVGAEVWPLESNVETCLIVQEGQIAKKCGGGGVGQGGWDDEGWRVRVNRVWRGRFADDAGKGRV